MEQLFFSKDMDQKLSRLQNCHIAMVEAPAGYGKTTAIQWAMRDIPPEHIHWYTAVSFLQDNSLD